MRFRSGYNWWLIMLIIIGIFIFFIVAISLFPSPSSYFYIIAALLLGWIYFGTFYTVLQDRIIIRSGPLKWTVLISDIIYIEPSRSPLSAPASSLDRLFIKHKKGFLLVSPKDQERFLQLLQEKNHKINIKKKGQ